jgi:hypothetical protein
MFSNPSSLELFQEPEVLNLTSSISTLPPVHPNLIL